MSRRLLPRRGRADVDPRPALLSVVALMFLLLPLLLLTTSPVKLVGLAFDLEGQGQDGAPPSSGRLEELEVALDGAHLQVRAALRTMDVTAGAGDVAWNTVELPPREGAPDLGALETHMERLHALDPTPGRVTVAPDDGAPTSRVVALIDTVRGSARRPLFQDVVLGGPAPGDDRVEVAP